MKQKLSVTIDEDLISKVDEKLEDKSFRNKSHFVEIAIEKYLEDSEDV